MEQKVNNTEPGIYEIGLNGAGHYELVVARRQSICPFAGAFPIHVQQQQSHLALPDDHQGQGLQTMIAGYARLPCSTGCPLAELHEETNGDLKYIVHCGGHPRTIIVTEIRPEQQANEPEDQTDRGKLITMD
jgi:hypothetical protein